jgi:hypothetical protein
MVRRSADRRGKAEASRQEMDAETAAPKATDHDGPVILPPLSSGWYEASTTYQYILREGRAEGRVEEVRKILLRLGHQRFGAPPVAIRQTLESLSDLDRMERMADRLLEIASWQELLDTP